MFPRSKKTFIAIPYPSDLENTGQLPVSQELDVTDFVVIWISLPTFSKSRDAFLAVFLFTCVDP